jgi:2-hydroxychromene-2-carboxylate isomerase/predicted thioesterase
VRPAALGRTSTYTVVPGPESTAAQIGNTGVVVVSSPYLIGMLEEASHRAIRDLYENGEATVGTRIDVSHVAPVFPGQEVIAQAYLDTVDGRHLRFAVRALQCGREVMRGTHERVVVQLDRFLLSSVGQATQSQETVSGAALGSGGGPIEYFFDYHSPWCYFASLRLGAFCKRLGRQLIWKPMHLARLIERIDGRRPLEANAAFVRWFKDDMQDWAAQLGVEVRYHPQFPLRPVRALRATAYAAQQGRAEPFVLGVMRAYWTESCDITDPEKLAQIGDAVGLDGRAVCASLEDPFFKRIVEDHTKEAQARGVFGAPTFFCDGKLFWGNDRLQQLEQHAMGAAQGEIRRTR